MRISTKGRYALRIMLDIAIHNSGEPVRVRDISERQNISMKYMEQIVAILTRAKYLRSVRGPQGGYLLTKKPSDYTVGSILRVTEGTLTPVDWRELDPDDVSIRIWKELDAAIAEVVDRYTLDDMLAWTDEAGMNFVI